MFVKCFGPAEPREVETDLRIERLGPETRRPSPDVMAVGFGFDATPEAHAFFDGAHFFEGDWASYGAYDGDLLVGVARMLAVPETESVAHLRGGDAAGRAATAVRRVHCSTSGSARRGTAASATPRPRPGWRTTENRNPSQHNMRRAGLTEVHTRPNWVWHRPSAG